MASVAERRFAPLEDRAPIALQYRLDGERLTGGGEPDPIALRDVRSAMITRNGIWLFTSAFATEPSRTAFVPGSASDNPLAAALATAGVETTPVSGCLERYGELTLVPRATAR